MNYVAQIMSFIIRLFEDAGANIDFMNSQGFDVMGSLFSDFNAYEEMMVESEGQKAYIHRVESAAKNFGVWLTEPDAFYKDYAKADEDTQFTFYLGVVFYILLCINRRPDEFKKVLAEVVELKVPKISDTAAELSAVIAFALNRDKTSV